MTMTKANSQGVNLTPPRKVGDDKLRPEDSGTVAIKTGGEATKSTDFGKGTSRPSNAPGPYDQQK